MLSVREKVYNILLAILVRLLMWRIFMNLPTFCVINSKPVLFDLLKLELIVIHI